MSLRSVWLSQEGCCPPDTQPSSSSALRHESRSASEIRNGHPSHLSRSAISSGRSFWLIGTMNPFECPFTLFSSAQSGVLSPNELTALVITRFSLSSLPPFHSNLSAVAFSIRVALEKMEQFSVCI